MTVTTRANLVILVVYGAVSLTLLWHHEPWNDEAQAWLLARDAPDLPTLLGRMSYEGSPGLWHLILRPFARAGFPFRTASVLNWLLCAAAVSLFVLRAPFSLPVRALLPFGYFMAYEYSAIARSYALTVLLLLAVAWLWPCRRGRTASAIGALLALLANCNTHGLIVSLVLTCALTVDRLAHREAGRRGALVPGAALACAGIALAALQLRPQPDLVPMLARWEFDPGKLIGRAARATCDAFMPLPAWQVQFWNHRADVPPCVVQAGALLALAGTTLSLRRRPLIAVAYLACCAGLFALFWGKHPGMFRHHGLIFAVFIACLWMAHDRGAAGGEVRPKTSVESGAARREWALTALLALQIPGLAPAAYFDLRCDFQPGRQVAQWLEEQGYADGGALIGAYYYGSLPGLAFLRNTDRRFFNLITERYDPYVVWDRYAESRVRASMAELLRRLDRERVRGGYSRVLLIMDVLPGRQAPELHQRFRRVAGWTESIAGPVALIYEERGVRRPTTPGSTPPHPAPPAPP